MIKKHIVRCTVILVLLVAAGVFAYHMPTTAKSHSENGTTTLKDTTQTTPKAAVPLSHMAQLNFADETLPLGDARVERKMKMVLTAYTYGRLQTNRLHRKAAEWFPVIEPILAAYGIPDDFKYIALVESGLQEGTSHKGASGIWQFMPGTARIYGLKVNRKIDERKNLRKSTIAAAKYIKELYHIFDSWTLVAAAYNVGDVHIQKEINKQNQDNYFKLKLNRETGGYVYKLISMKEVVENPARYGYRPAKGLIAYRPENKFKAYN